MSDLRYPHLGEEGVEQFKAIIDSAKTEIVKAAEGAISDLYVDIGAYIESDAWCNVRNSILDDLTAYLDKHDNKRIRNAIFRDHHDEIISDLNADLVAENESLKDSLAMERDMRLRY